MSDAAERLEEPAGPGSGRRAADLSVVIALTAQVEAAMADGDWQQAADLEAQRRAALSALLGTRGVAAVDPELRDALAGILSRTHRLLGEAHHHRRALLRDAEMVRLGRRAASEYTDNAT